MDRRLFGQILRAGMPRLFRWIPVLGVLIVALGVLSLSTTSTTPMLGYIEIIGGLFAACLPLIVLLSGYQRLARLARQPWRYHLTDRTIEEATPTVTSSRPWTAVRKVVDRPDLWVLRMDPGGVIGLPKNAFDPDQRAELEAFLRTRPVLASTTAR